MVRLHESATLVLTWMTWSSLFCPGFAVPTIARDNDTGQGQGHNCTRGLIWHNKTGVCCVPYFNCPHGFGITECSVEGEQDQCLPCPEGQGQHNLVSSLDMEEARCYSLQHTEVCPPDTKPSRQNPLVWSCVWMCECNNDKCYYGNDSCRCRRKYPEPCGPGETLNRTTGACEKCQWYAYKENVGCEPCRINATLWSQGQPEPRTTSSVPTTTGTAETTPTTEIATPDSVIVKNASHPGIDKKEESESSDTVNPSNLNILLVILVAVIVVVVAIVGTAGFLYCYWRRNISGANNMNVREEMHRHDDGGESLSSVSSASTDNPRCLSKVCFGGEDDPSKPLLTEAQTDRKRFISGVEMGESVQKHSMERQNVDDATAAKTKHVQASNRGQGQRQHEGEGQSVLAARSPESQPNPANGAQQAASALASSSEGGGVQDPLVASGLVQFCNNTIANSNINIIFHPPKAVIKGNSGAKESEVETAPDEERPNIPPGEFPCVSNADNMAAVVGEGDSPLNNLDDGALKPLNISKLIQPEQRPSRGLDAGMTANLDDDLTVDSMERSNFPSLNEDEIENAAFRRSTRETTTYEAQSTLEQNALEALPSPPGVGVIEETFADKADTKETTKAKEENKSTAKEEKTLRARPVGKVAPFQRHASVIDQHTHSVPTAVRRSISDGVVERGVEGASLEYAFVQEGSPLSTAVSDLYSMVDGHESFSNGIYEDSLMRTPNSQSINLDAPNTIPAAEVGATNNGNVLVPRSGSATRNLSIPGSSREETHLKTPYSSLSSISGSINDPATDREETQPKTPYLSTGTEETIPKVIDEEPTAEGGHNDIGKELGQTGLQLEKDHQGRSHMGPTLKRKTEQGQKGANEDPGASDSIYMAELKEGNHAQDALCAPTTVSKPKTAEEENGGKKVKAQQVKAQQVKDTSGHQQLDVKAELTNSYSCGPEAMGTEVNRDSIKMETIQDVSTEEGTLSERFLSSGDPRGLEDFVNEERNSVTEPSDRFQLDSTSQLALGHSVNQSDVRGEHSGQPEVMNRSDSFELSSEDIENLNRELS